MLIMIRWEGERYVEWYSFFSDENCTDNIMKMRRPERQANFMTPDMIFFF